MLDWVFEGIISWVGQHVNSLLDAVSGIMLDTLGIDMTVMSSYFPFLDSAFQTIKYIGIALLLLMVIWQLFRAFAGPVLEAENPLTLLGRGVLAAFCIWNSAAIFDVLLYIARAPYEVLQGMPVAAYTFSDIYTFLLTSLQNMAFGGALSMPILTLLAIILLLALGWNYLKLLLEVVERYIMVGVLYFTSPLAFSMMGTKSTANVFKAWCRMIGSELLLLVLNVWFVRGYNSGVTVLMMNGGVIPGRPAAGAILCLFCLLAYLKIAQKFDSYLATLGLNTAQTGGNLGMEMLVMTRMVGSMVGHGGFLPGSGRVSSTTGGGPTGTAGTAAPTGFGARIRAAFNPETYRANAISSGPNQGIRGLNGWALNAIAARQIRQGHGTDAATVSKITSGVITPRGGAFAGTSADNSLTGFMPMFKGSSLSGTSIENGYIKTTAVSPAGRKAEFVAFSTQAFEKPDGSYRTVTASDGSRWYVTARGEGAEDFFSTPKFNGIASESSDVAAMFPSERNISSLKTVGDGQMEASYADGTRGMMYSAALFEEPEGPHEVITDEKGTDWYRMEPKAILGDFTDGNPGPAGSDKSISADADDSSVPGDDTPVPGVDIPIPGPEIPVSGVDTSVPEPDTPASGVDISVPGLDTPVSGADASVSGLDTPVSGVDASVSGSDTQVPDTGVPVPNPEASVSRADKSELGIDTPVAGADTRISGMDISVPNADTAVPPVATTVTAEVPEMEGRIAETGISEKPADGIRSEAVAASVPQNMPADLKAESTAVEIPAFSGMPEGTHISSVGNGMYEMRMPDGQTQTVYDSAMYSVPDGDKGIVDTVTDTAGNSYFIPAQDASVTEISKAETAHNAIPPVSNTPAGNSHTVYDGSAPTEDLSARPDSVIPPGPQYQGSPADTAHADIRTDYHGIESTRGSFASFMPGYGADVTKVDTSLREEGQFTVFNKDGSGTRFYDMTMYRPIGNYRVFEDRNGHSWAAYDGRYQNVRQVVTDQNGNPVVDKHGRAKERYETVMTFRQEPQRIKGPTKKKSTEAKTPRRKRK